MAIRIGVVGLGKIAHDQHLPVIAGSPDFDLISTASHHGHVDGVPGYQDIEAMLAAQSDLQAVSLCQPPQARFDAARKALEAGKHVFLEKPPGATLSEVELLRDMAERRGLTLFASWHSRYAPGIEKARAWLAERRIRQVKVDWMEDVRRWHPGQAWIWQPGGLGVFDPGINALSIVTHILPGGFHLTGARLAFPANRAAPIAADLSFGGMDGATIEAAFDWRQTGPQTWNIRVETGDGTLLLSMGGAELSLDGVRQEVGPEAEYRGLYDRFAELVASGRSDVDVAPLRHVADAFLRGERQLVEPFED